MKLSKFIQVFCNALFCLNSQIIIQIYCVSSSKTILSTFNNFSKATVRASSAFNVGGKEVVFRIVDGFPADIDEIPYQVALMRKEKEEDVYKAYCGGSIIRPTKILTAAHCVHRKTVLSCFKGYRFWFNYKNEYVVAGQLKSKAIVDQEGQWRNIKSARYPHAFTFYKDDIAVVTVYYGFNYNSGVQPINYARKSLDYGGMICRVSGYGSVDIFVLNREPAKTLQIGYVQVLSMQLCNIIHEQDIPNVVCTSDQFADMRKGDSGGPLVCKHTDDPAEENSTNGLLVGVISGTTNRYMGTFSTRVSYYKDFINGRSSRAKTSLYYIVCIFIFFQYTPFRECFRKF